MRSTFIELFKLNPCWTERKKRVCSLQSNFGNLTVSKAVKWIYYQTEKFTVKTSPLHKNRWTLALKLCEMNFGSWIDPLLSLVNLVFFLDRGNVTGGYNHPFRWFNTSTFEYKSRMTRWVLNFIYIFIWTSRVLSIMDSSLGYLVIFRCFNFALFHYYYFYLD